MIMRDVGLKRDILAVEHWKQSLRVGLAGTKTKVTWSTSV